MCIFMRAHVRVRQNHTHHAPTQVLCLLGLLPTKVGDCEEEEGYEEKHARSVSVCESGDGEMEQGEEDLLDRSKM